MAKGPDHMTDRGPTDSRPAGPDRPSLFPSGTPLKWTETELSTQTAESTAKLDFRHRTEETKAIAHMAESSSSMASSSASAKSDAETEELLDRMLTRLALCDDSKLEALLSKLLPLCISSLSSPSQAVRSKVSCSVSGFR